jgi:hypothetical protein
VLVLRCMYAVTLVHGAEARLGPERELTLGALAQTSTFLVRAMFHRSMDPNYWAYPTVTLIVTGLALALQWGLRFTCAEEIVELLSDPHSLGGLRRRQGGGVAATAPTPSAPTPSAPPPELDPAEPPPGDEEGSLEQIVRTRHASE